MPRSSKIAQSSHTGFDRDKAVQRVFEIASETERERKKLDQGQIWSVKGLKFLPIGLKQVAFHIRVLLTTEYLSL